MPDSPRGIGSPAYSRDRRLSPRIRASAVLLIDLRRSGQPVPVQDVSVSGFAIESPAPIEPGTMHRSTLIPKQGEPVTVLAQAVRSDRAPGTSHYVVGFRFSMMEVSVRQQVNQVIEAVARRQRIRLS